MHVNRFLKFLYASEISKCDALHRLHYEEYCTIFVCDSHNFIKSLCLSGIFKLNNSCTVISTCVQYIGIHPVQHIDTRVCQSSQVNKDVVFLRFHPHKVPKSQIYRSTHVTQFLFKSLISCNIHNWQNSHIFYCQY